MKIFAALGWAIVALVAISIIYGIAVAGFFGIAMWMQTGKLTQESMIYMAPMALMTLVVACIVSFSKVKEIP